MVDKVGDNWGVFVGWVTGRSKAQCMGKDGLSIFPSLEWKQMNALRQVI